ncbi:hypothetical protein Z949_699 [Sulfitobacter guttiformis KCTC 32187]|nr:hypothetical protein Z949_699 [Sulfitobacter guttiformis KCTC 32187]
MGSNGPENLCNTHRMCRTFAFVGSGKSAAINRIATLP